MGYTHYISDINLGPNAIGDWVYAANKIIQKYNDIVIDSDDRIVECGRQNWIEKDDIIFANGYEDNGHETLYISNTMGNSNFCKTARKPYDSVVVASYLYGAITHGASFSTDGYRDDLTNGINLLRSCFDIDEEELNKVLENV